MNNMTNALGTEVTHRGARGTVVAIDFDGYTETMLVVRFEGRTAVLRPREVGHTLSWSCACSVCVTARKTLGRAW